MSLNGNPHLSPKLLWPTRQTDAKDFESLSVLYAAFPSFIWVLSTRELQCQLKNKLLNPVNSSISVQCFAPEHC